MKRPIICTYYFPNWHVDERNEKLHGKGWTEWRVVKLATPRFPGHEQPKVPLWGYGDEADPKVMAQKIKAAADHGIDAFVFDYYWFSDGSYRERCLLEGFLPAPNCRDIQFALMWANHNPVSAHPSGYCNLCMPLWSGDVSPETFLKCTDHIIKTYFIQPNYLRVRGKLFFSIYRPQAMIEQLGGQRVASLLFRDFRRRVEEAGLGELNLDAILYNMGDPETADERLRQVGFDSCSDYAANRRGKGFPAFEYSELTEQNIAQLKPNTESISIPYNPVIVTGFDNSPRTVQSDMLEDIGYPYTPIAAHSTPQEFEKALVKAAEFMNSPDATGDILHISCWNEWTEGAYLEPDTLYGTGRLEAIRKVFGTKIKQKIQKERK